MGNERLIKRRNDKPCKDMEFLTSYPDYQDTYKTRFRGSGVNQGDIRNTVIAVKESSDLADKRPKKRKLESPSIDSCSDKAFKKSSSNRQPQIDRNINVNYGEVNIANPQKWCHTNKFSVEFNTCKLRT